MKSIKFIVIALLMFTVSGFAQTKDSTDTLRSNTAAADTVSADTTASADSISLSGIVASQIAAARQKQLNDSVNTAQVPVVKQEPAKSELTGIAAGILEKARGFYNANTDLVLKAAFLLSVSLAVFIIVFIRRRRLRPKKKFESTLKNNIRKLREEKIEFSINPDLKMMRKNLVQDPSFNFTSHDSISRTARELNISKGELMLAARIKSHEMARSCLSK